MKKQGFTLIELIVVITILAILGTIAFISFKGYSGDTRDAKVISDTTNIHKGLTLYKTSTGKVPMPENAVEVKYGSTTITYEGKISNTIKNLINIDKNAKTPSGDDYMYATNGNNKYFNVIGLLENEQSNIITTVSAEANIKYFKGDNILTLFNSDGELIPGDAETPHLVSNLDKVFLGENELEIVGRNINGIPEYIKQNRITHAVIPGTEFIVAGNCPAGWTDAGKYIGVGSKKVAYGPDTANVSDIKICVSNGNGIPSDTIIALEENTSGWTKTTDKFWIPQNNLSFDSAANELFGNKNTSGKGLPSGTKFITTKCPYIDLGAPVKFRGSLEYNKKIMIDGGSENVIVCKVP